MEKDSYCSRKQFGRLRGTSPHSIESSFLHSGMLRFLARVGGNLEKLPHVYQVNSGAVDPSVLDQVLLSSRLSDFVASRNLLKLILYVEYNTCTKGDLGFSSSSQYLQGTIS
jgi:hypothetical protein